MSKISGFKRGFTLVEVALFLAVTGALFVGIALGTQNTITRQRYNDSVQNFAEFLRGIYSEVSNPQSVSTGRSETTAIYGKLVVFGEKVGLDGTEFDENSPGIDGEESQRIYVYDVVGDVSGSGTGSGTGSVPEMLDSLDANVVVAAADNKIEPAGIVESYSPRWGALIEKVVDREDDNKVHSGKADDAWTGSILVVRHPRSGTINTLISQNVIEVNEVVEYHNKNPSSNIYEKLLTDELGSFEVKQVDFCVNQYGLGQASDDRRDIRIVANARNASGVELIDLDSEENLCKPKSQI